MRRIAAVLSLLCPSGAVRAHSRAAAVPRRAALASPALLWPACAAAAAAADDEPLTPFSDGTFTIAFPVLGGSRAHAAAPRAVSAALCGMPPREEYRKYTAVDEHRHEH